jgi:hypothetical protein
MDSEQVDARIFFLFFSFLIPPFPLLSILPFPLSFYSYFNYIQLLHKWYRNFLLEYRSV